MPLLRENKKLHISLIRENKKKGTHTEPRQKKGTHTESLIVIFVLRNMLGIEELQQGLK